MSPCQLLCMILTLLSSFCVTATLNMSNVPWIRKDRCTIRYAFKEATKGLFTCEEVIANIPLCGRDIVVGYSHSPPHIFQENTTFVGILLGIINEALIRTCCFNCTNLKVLPPMGFLEKFTNWSSIDLIIPIEGSEKAREFFGLNFYPLIGQKSISFIGKAKRQQEIDILILLIDTVVESWPFLLLAMSMALTAGSFIWVLDTWYNKSQFPRNFPRGPFEGFWWAYVSMTTVGYGDRTPTSIAAKVFAVIWILIGVLFFNMYTATFTSILSTAMNREHKFEMMGEKVGVLNHSTASYIGISKHLAVPVAFPNVSSMALALAKDEIHAIAMEDRTAVYYLKEFQRVDASIHIHTRMSIDGSYVGFATANWELFKMLESFFDANRESIDVMGDTAYREQNEVDFGFHVSIDGKEFHKFSPFTAAKEKILFACIIFCGFAVAIGILGHILNLGVKRRKLIRNSTTKMQDSNLANNYVAKTNSGYNDS